MVSFRVSSQLVFVRIFQLDLMSDSKVYCFLLNEINFKSKTKLIMLLKRTSNWFFSDLNSKLFAWNFFHSNY